MIEKIGHYIHYFSQRKAGLFVLGTVLFLTGMGLIILSSASLSFIKSEDYFFKQIVWCLIGIPFFLIGALIDLKFLQKQASLFLIIFSIGLALVLIPGIGKLVNGSRRWINCCGINVQISEFAKIAILIWLADYLEKNADHHTSFIKGFFKPLFIVGVVDLLILMEPDYGTFMLLGAVSFTLLFLSGTPLRYLLLTMSLGIVGMGTLIYFTPTRMRRITAFLDVEANKLDSAYQLYQGMLGFVSGGLLGRGLGQGRQQLTYLPEAHTDFIFPIYSEEFGALLSIATLLLYLVIFWTIAHCARRMTSLFAKYLSYGIGLILAYQVIINVGVVTGLLPTKGMVLPFISYGGSNLVLVFFMIGLLINCMSSEAVLETTEDYPQF